MLIIRIDVKDGRPPIRAAVAHDLDVERIRRYLIDAEAAFERCQELDEQEAKKCSQST
ncbi:MAG: hypothetical protein KAX57_08770 [Rhodoferax sp.]|nr:hypothetical protein [Rhodoferax sp.]